MSGGRSADIAALHLFDTDFRCFRARCGELGGQRVKVDAVEALEGPFADAVLLGMMIPAEAYGEPVARLASHSRIRTATDVGDLDRHAIAAGDDAVM
ncbi:hypothetical protein JI59_18640 [Novosphingobium pentaromativorans US6-1]|nr:hypothetical protein JI59_18640 [Novosphingobium pentaromativorans US6-1]